MLRSMTAFGRAAVQGAWGQVVVEITSLNKKALEIQISAFPKGLLRFEVDIRNWIAEAVSRGQLFVRITADFKEASPVTVRANLSLVRQLKSAWQDISKEWGSSGNADVAVLAGVEGILCYSDAIQEEKVFLEALHGGVSEALAMLMAMKAREGATLQKDIVARAESIKGFVDAVSARAGGATTRYREHIRQALRDAGLAEDAVEEERLLREVCLFADKVDIAEEVTRLRSHLEHLSQILSGKEWRVGKKVEFILQELLREINTVGSKSADYEVSRLVVEVKGELERIREQIQNVE